MQLSLDIVIPSFRLNEAILGKILLLKRPEEVTIMFYLIADNPTVNISAALLEIIEQNNVRLIINQTNLGFSRTRNLGIDAGSGDWILLLDDDIDPDENLLFAYTDAIKKFPEALGFAGVTRFPPAFNNVTNALYLNGSVGHFAPTEKNKEIVWTPTANVLLNRKKLAGRRFIPELTNGGEDIELLSRNSLDNQQRYLTWPDAVVTHPWWNNGKSQVKRMYRYGKGIGDIIDRPYQKQFTYYDFTTTVETIFIVVILALLLGSFIHGFWSVALLMILGTSLAEFLTNCFKCYKLSRKFSMGLTVQMILHKNAVEAGLLASVLSQRKFNYLFKRLDVTFTKVNPSPFRLNRWKITKLIITVLLFAVYLSFRL
jgi:glycosyltransferase involved in cell wall biosynthesis